MATRKKTLYEVLQVARTASPEVIASAYETRLRNLENSSAPEVLVERGLLRDAHAILSDPTRRKLYDDKLREEALRAAGSGGDAHYVPPRASTASVSTPPESSPLGWMIGIALLAAVGLGGTWMYLDHKRASDRMHQEELQQAEQARQQEEAAKRQEEQADWAKAQYEKTREDIEMQRWEAQRRRDQAMTQRERDQYARQQSLEAQRQAMDARRAEAERQRQDQENLRRDQMELQRQQRYLRELESNRGMKF